MIKTNLKSLEPSKVAFSVPVTLLSHGYFAPDKIPGGMITVFPWDSGVDDWIQERVRKPHRDRLLWDLAAQLSNTNGVPIDLFPIGDINTILLVARAILRKNVITYTPVCTVCSAANKEESVRVPDELERIGEKDENYPGFDVITLPESGDVVKVRPLTVGDEISIASRGKELRKSISDRLAKIYATIVDVGGGIPDNAVEVDRWWKALHPSDTEFFESRQNSLFPHLGTDITHQCDSCGATFVHQLSLDREFFRGGR